MPFPLISMSASGGSMPRLSGSMDGHTRKGLIPQSLMTPFRPHLTRSSLGMQLLHALQKFSGGFVLGLERRRVQVHFQALQLLQCLKLNENCVNLQKYGGGRISSRSPMAPPQSSGGAARLPPV